MARIRTIKPEFFQSVSLAACPRDARLTFAGLWTEADDLGRGRADPRLLKGQLWPFDDDITPVTISDHLEVLEATGHVRLYVVDGCAYYEVVHFAEHQSAAYRRGEAKYPPPVLQDFALLDVQKSAESRKNPEKLGKPSQDKGNPGLHDFARGEMQKSAGREGKGREGNMERKGTLTPPTPPPVTAEPPPDPIFEALYQATTGTPYTPGTKLTGQERGILNKATRELKTVDATPDEIQRRATHFFAWTGQLPTPGNLTTHWTRLDQPQQRATTGQLADLQRKIDDQARRQRLAQRANPNPNPKGLPA